jgi:hypothetical protein
MQQKARTPASPEGRSPGEDLSRNTRPQPCAYKVGGTPKFLFYFLFYQEPNAYIPTHKGCEIPTGEQGVFVSATGTKGKQLMKGIDVQIYKNTAGRYQSGVSAGDENRIKPISTG